MRRMKKAGRAFRPACQHGQAMLEFVVALPLLLFLLISIIDIGYLTYQRTVIQSAARDAARAIAVGEGSAAAADQAGRDLTMGHIDPAAVQWSVNSNGTYVTVELTFDRKMLIPGLPALFGAPPFAHTVPLHGGATFRQRG